MPHLTLKNLDSNRTSPLERTRVLIVDDHPTKCMGLAQIINQLDDFVVCLESENVYEALEVVEKKHIDFAVVEVLSPTAQNIQLETIKLAQPDLPILILSMTSVLIDQKDQVPDDLATDQIVKALKYVQSLLKSRIMGFTVFVEVEKAEQLTEQ